MEAAQYPKRPKFFSNRFCRVLAKACAANDIGPEACWLLTVIVNTEDAKGYRGAVTFFNEQLAPLVGLQNVKALDRVRKRAVQAGWLVYAPGGKSVPGRYWVNVPEMHRDWDDAPSDEGAGLADYTWTKSTTEPGEKRDRSGIEAGTEPGEKRETSGQPSSLSLSLSLSQDPLPPRGGGDAGDYAAVPATGDESDPGPEREGRGSRRPAAPLPPGGFDPTAAEPEIVTLDAFDSLLAEWTAAKLPGHDAPRGIQVTAQRRGWWQNRLADPQWRASWREAVRRAGRSAACRGANPKFMAQGLRIDTFLREPDALARILEGNYDDPVPVATGPPGAGSGAGSAAESKARLDKLGIKPLAYPPRPTKPPGAA